MFASGTPVRAHGTNRRSIFCVPEHATGPSGANGNSGAPCCRSAPSRRRITMGCLVHPRRAFARVVLVALLATPVTSGLVYSQTVTQKPVIPKKGDIDYYNGLALTPTMGF